VSGLAGQVRLLICAVQFLTRLPTPRLDDFDPDWLARSARYFPLVGQLVGLISAAVWLAAGRLWPGLSAALLAVGASILITGAFHEDGLGDTADGLGGGHDAQQRLAIMKDSRIGAYGTLAVGLVTALRVVALSQLSPAAGAVALIAAHGLARAAAVAVMVALPYAGDPHASKTERPTRGVRAFEAMIALAIGVWPLAFLSPIKALLSLSLSALGAMGLAVLSRKLIGGVTGDVLGAVEQISEASILLSAAAQA
jgi:adenosylcobinamide-GDP ribazoletransferase